MSDEHDFSSTSAGDEHGRTFRAEYDWTTISPSTAIVESVAEAKNSDPTALESLYDWIDTDAIDALFERPSGDPSDPPLSVSFDYTGYTVTVERNGTVTVEPAAEG